jgi:hypothetical protein
VAVDHDKRVSRFAAADVARGRNGGALTIDSFPDEEERTAPAVDVIAHDEIGPIVVEHTVVESYPAQLHDNKSMSEVFSGFAERFGRSLEPPGAYTLAIDTTGGHRFPRAKVPITSPAWTRGCGPSDSRFLRTRSPCPTMSGQRRPRFRCRWSCIGCGAPRKMTAPCESSSTGPWTSKPGGQTASRLPSPKKAPKLEAWRQPQSATVLALESRDYVMANPWTIAKVTHDVAHDFPGLPDFIIVIDTTGGEGHWIAYTVKKPSGWMQSALGTSTRARP